MWLRRLCFSVCLVAIAAPVASAEDEVGEYAEYVALGVKAFEKGDFYSAREAFMNAYELYPNAVLLFNIASTYRREGDFERATRFYLRFLDAAEPEDPRVDLARTTLREMAEEAEKAEKAEKAEPEPEPEPAPKPKPKPKPKKQAKPKQPERPRRAEPPAERPTVDLSASAPRPSGSAGGAWKWTGGALAGLGAVAVGVGVLDLRRAERASDELAALSSGSTWDDEQAALVQEGRDADRRGTILTVAGGAAVATGIVFYVIGERASRRAERPRVTPYATGDAAGVALTGTF